MTKLVCDFLEEKMVESKSVEENATFLCEKFYFGRKPPLEGDGNKAVELKAARKKLKEMRESFEALVLENRLN